MQLKCIVESSTCNYRGGRKHQALCSLRSSLLDKMIQQKWASFQSSTGRRASSPTNLIQTHRAGFWLSYQRYTYICLFSPFFPHIFPSIMFYLASKSGLQRENYGMKLIYLCFGSFTYILVSKWNIHTYTCIYAEQLQCKGEKSI